MTVVAAFDVDGTVTTRDCVVPFLRRVAGTAPMSARLALSIHRLAPALARRDRDALKALATHAVFTGRRNTDIDNAGDAFAELVARDWLREDTVARIRWHGAEGHRVVFVSASYAAYLRPLARRLAVDDVVATELEVDADGRCGGRDSVELWAYGDSPGDREMLATADRPVWV